MRGLAGANDLEFLGCKVRNAVSAGERLTGNEPAVSEKRRKILAQRGPEMGSSSIQPKTNPLTG